MRKSSIAVVLVVLYLGYLALAPTAGFAQAVYGSIFGIVTDTSGAAVSGAKVTVTSLGKGTKVETTTNDTGNYVVTHLIPGKYDVRAELAGFKAFEVKAIDVFADTATPLDAKIQVGAVTETVTVTAEETPMLKTDRADVATLFTEKVVTELPIFNRNFTDFQLLTPGTQKLGWSHAASENPQGSLQINVNGQHFSGSSFQLDGTDNRDPILGIIVINPNLESVTETKIATQNYDAEFGQALAAVITAQTRSGTNEIHGSAFWFRRSDQLQARDPFTQSTKNSLTGKFIPDSLWNQYGGSVGGPILKNKLFVFGDYQGTRQKVGNSQRLSVPTLLVRNTCLAGVDCDLSEYLGAGQIYDPNSGNQVNGTGRTAFNGNIIPVATRPLSSQAVALLKLLPAPNTTTGTSQNGTIGNFVASGTGGFDNDVFDVRVDHSTTSKMHIFGRYSLADFRLTGRGAFDTGSIFVGGHGLGLDGFAGESKTRNHSLASGFDYAVSSSLYTDFRFGYFKYHVTVNPNGLGSTPAKDVGILGLNTSDPLTGGMPAFFIGDGGQAGGDIAFGYGLSDRLARCNCPLIENEDQFQVVNNWSKIVSNHNFKLGADIRYARNLRVPSDAHRAGELSFYKERTEQRVQNPDGTFSANGGVPLASFLLSDVGQLQRYVSTTSNAGERQKRWFFYGQDTWRVTPNLTFNYGLRWEIYFPQTVTSTGAGGFVDVATGNVLVAGVGGIDSSMNVENSLKNFAPRLGVAYRWRQKTVIRMGYGRSFDIGVFGSIFGHSVTQNLPVLARQQVQGADKFLSAFSLTPPGAPGFVFPTVPSSGQFPLPDGVNQFIQTKRMRLPTVDAWNLTVQREVTPSLTAEIGYVGNKGTHVFAGNGPDYNCNQPSVVGFATGVSNSARRPFFPKFGWTQDLRCHLEDASNNYHALQTKVEKRFSHGYQFLAHYTWAKAINFDGDYYNTDPKVNRGPNDFNRAHVFVLVNLWELPVGKGKRFAGNISRMADYLIGGWQVNAVTNWSSGLPFSPSYNECGNDRDTGPCRPDIVGNVESGISKNGWFTISSGPLATNGTTSGPWRRPQVGQFGTAGRNSLYGPRFFNTDMSLFKNFVITERVRGQFRFEAFNFFNHVNLGTPSNCVDCSDGGKITSTAAPLRQLQFGLKFGF